MKDLEIVLDLKCLRRHVRRGLDLQGSVDAKHQNGRTPETDRFIPWTWGRRLARAVFGKGI